METATGNAAGMVDAADEGTRSEVVAPPPVDDGVDSNDTRGRIRVEKGVAVFEPTWYTNGQIDFELFNIMKY